MTRHRRIRKEPPATPDRRTFVLQLYDNGYITRRRHDAPNFELEAKVLDVLANRIDALLGPTKTTIRHDVGSFNCYVGTCPQDSVLIVEPRLSCALNWSLRQKVTWCRQIANAWLKISGHPPLAGNDSETTNGDEDRAAENTLTTGRDDAQA